MRSTSDTRAAAILMAALAMVVKLVFAPGLMPAVERGAPTLVICTGQGAKVITDPAGQHSQAHKPCPFEGQAPLGPTETPQPLLTARAEYPAPMPAFHSAVAPGSGLTAPPPPSTGPPSKVA